MASMYILDQQMRFEIELIAHVPLFVPSEPTAFKNGSLVLLLRSFVVNGILPLLLTEF
jgi:uncharacterized protein YpmS